MKGRVYLEYEENGVLKSKNCKVLGWNMNPTTGDSNIVFVVPPILPRACNVVVDPYGSLPTDEEVDGFVINAPEITSIGPNFGSAGDHITIRGKFFGTKKGRVYFGYVVRGKLIKRSFPVLSWTAEATIDGDEIVFVVPNLPSGTYDVIIQNSVGLDELTGGFTIQ